jgi:microcystin-dependent protein
VPEIVVRVAPAPGTVQPGNLYVDLQSLTLWLGVNTSVDPDGAKLISDIEGTLQLIAEVLQDANAYTDQEVALRAPKHDPVFTGNPRGPTPLATDNDDSLATTAFVKTAMGSVTTGMWAPGMIMSWGGLIADIGVGTLANWAPCNGTAVSRAAYPELWQKLGTMHGAGDGSTTFNLPDLRERFILGAGSRAPGVKNPSSAEAITNVNGTHAHTVNGHVLTASEIPAHVHSSGTLSGPVLASSQAVASGTAVTVVKAGAAGNVNIGQANINAGQTGNPTVVGGAAHDHTLISNGGHDHHLTAADLREAVPYYALCYMIRLKA